MFEQLVSQVSGRFGLPEDKTKQLLGMVIGQVFNESKGGPTAFLQSFRDKGMGDVVSSWLGTGDNLPVNGAQVSNVLGSDVVSSLSQRLGLPGATVSDAAAALLPTAVSSLATNGSLDVGMWDRAKGWFGGMLDHDWIAPATAAAVTGTVAAGSAAASERPAVTPPVAPRVTPPSASTPPVVPQGSGSFWKWLLPLLLVLLAIWAFRSCSHPAAPAADAAAPVTADASTAAPAAATAAAPAADAAASAAAPAAAAATAALGALTANSTVADYKKALDMVPIVFDTGKATIKAESNAVLDTAAKAISSMKAGTKIEINGYTDSAGNATSNLKLSQARADAVKAALVERKIDAAMLTTKGQGDANPIASNDTAEGKAKNRRIEYIVQ